MEKDAVRRCPRIWFAFAATIAILFRSAALSAESMVQEDTSPRVAAIRCKDLVGLRVSDAVVTRATSNRPPFGRVSPRVDSAAMRFCRVSGSIKPTEDSDIRFEVWLPASSFWNGKYEGVGNGGFAGSIDYDPMIWAIDGGYVVSGTDTGHIGNPTDARWAIGHPQKVIDFGWRAIHETASTSKAIIQTYYGRAAAHAYFAGCSDGGREALMEAQRFPEDYDGIVAGAPANYWTQLMARFAWDEQSMVDAPGGALAAKKLHAISNAARSACHKTLGVIDNPSRCRFDPSILLCKGAESDSCLTATQIDTLRKIYSGPPNIVPPLGGFEPGGEADPDGWGVWITGTGSQRGEGSLQLAFARAFMSNMVFGNPSWELRNLNFDPDMKVAEAKTAGALNAADPDLGRFRRGGGKLIQYHGWFDAAIPPTDSIHYYEAVAAKVGGIYQAQSFYRLFMAAGMQHCGGGDGPNAVSGPFGLPAPSHDAAHDVVAVADWVEHGTAPAQIIATKYNHNDPREAIEMQRPWCPYPAEARYLGHGSENEPANFVCETIGP